MVYKVGKRWYYIIVERNKNKGDNYNERTKIS